MMYFCYAVTAYISRALTGYSFRRQSTAVCAGRRLRLVCSARRSTGAVREIISRSFLSGFYNLVHADCPCLREFLFLLQRDDTAGIVLYSRAERDSRSFVPPAGDERESRGTSPSGAVCARPPAAQAEKTAISALTRIAPCPARQKGEERRKY